MKKWLLLGIIPFIFTACGLNKPMESVNVQLPTGQTYLDYTPEVAQKYAGQPHVLYFFANWCPNCRSHDQAIKDNITTLPTNTRILRVNYDTETELKKTYNVTNQTTSVMIGADGTVISTNQSPDISDYQSFFASQNTAGINNAPIEKNAAYVIYDEKVETLRKGTRHIIFFYADWCPTCVAWEKNLTGDFMKIVGNAFIIRANYDTQTALKEQYGITNQSTAVFIDEQGEVIEKVAEPSVAKINEFFMANQNTLLEKIAATPKLNAQYVMYNENLKTRLDKTQHIKFFYADWCPTCVTWEKNLTDNLNNLPPNTFIVRVNYDNETELKKQYSITTQSTAVFIDNTGKVIKTIADPSLDEITKFFAAE